MRGTVGGSAASETERVLVCRIGSRAYALPLSCVAETMRPVPIEPVAGAPALVAGLSVIRGEPVPVLDGARLVGDGSGSSGWQRFVLLKLAERRAAVAVHEVRGVRRVPGDALGAVPPLLGEIASGPLAALAAVDGEILLVLREIRTVPDAVWAAVGREATANEADREATANEADREATANEADREATANEADGEAAGSAGS